MGCEIYPGVHHSTWSLDLICEQFKYSLSFFKLLARSTLSTLQEIFVSMQSHAGTGTRDARADVAAPCTYTPSPKSGTSTEDDPAHGFLTPSAQIKRSLSLQSTDSTDSALQALLNCTDHVNCPRAVPVASFSPSVMQTLGGDADVSSQETHPSASQDSCATLPSKGYPCQVERHPVPCQRVTRFVFNSVYGYP